MKALKVLLTMFITVNCYSLAPLPISCQTERQKADFLFKATLDKELEQNSSPDIRDIMVETITKFNFCYGEQYGKVEQLNMFPVKREDYYLYDLTYTQDGEKRYFFVKLFEDKKMNRWANFWYMDSSPALTVVRGEVFSVNSTRALIKSM